MRIFSVILPALSFLAFSLTAQALPPLNDYTPTDYVPDQTRGAKAVSAQPSKNFVCPDPADDSDIACFVNATAHLYNVCSRVKMIEIAEHGFGRGEMGRNSFKSDFCRQKQRASIPAYFDRALREAESKNACDAVLQLSELYTAWDMYLSALTPHQGETETAFRGRLDAPADAFLAYGDSIREALASAPPVAKGKKRANCQLTRAVVMKQYRQTFAQRDNVRRSRAMDGIADK